MYGIVHKMEVLNLITEKTVDIDEKITVYVQRRNLKNRLPYAKDFDKIKLSEAVKGETVQTFIYSEGDKIPEVYKVM